MPKGELQKQRPPNYGSRRMQVRLLLLVASLMLVFVMMNEARKPKNWMWMGFESVEPVESPDASRASTRLADLFSNEGYDNSFLSALARDEEPPLPEELARREQIDETVQRVLQRVFEQLTGELRLRLYLDLRSMRQLERLEVEGQVEREQLAEQMARRVDDELATFRAMSIEPLTGSVPEEWASILDESQGRLSLFGRVLRGGGLPDDLTVGELQQLQELLRQFDRLALEQVKDNTLGPRQEEQFAWYRVFEKLAGVKGEATADRVTVFELSEKPTVYRGRGVELSGEVRGLKPVELRENPLGPRDFWELWLRPDSGPDIPVCVYVRRLPDGFPRDLQSSELLEVRESATIVGVFFKNMSYRAEGGLRVAPLVLADTIQWRAKEPVVSATGSGTNRFLLLVVAVLFSVVVSLVVAWWVQRMTRRSREVRELPGTIKLPLLAVALVVGCVGSQTVAQEAEGVESAGEQVGAVASEDSEATSQLPPWLAPQGTVATGDAETIFDWFDDLQPSSLDRLGDFNRWDPNSSVVQTLLSRLAYRLPVRDPLSLAGDSTGWEQVRQSPTELRGRFVRVKGRVESVREVRLSDATWESFERDAIFEVSIELEFEGATRRVLAWVAEVPKAWEAGGYEGDRVGVAGVFLHLESRDRQDGVLSGEGATDGVPLVLGMRTEWFPDVEELSPWVGYWTHDGFDFGLWEIPSRREGQPLSSADGECFYPLLRRCREAFAGEVDHPKVADLELFELLRHPNDARGSVFGFSLRVKRITEVPVEDDVFAREAGVSSYYQVDGLLSLDGKRVKLGSEENQALITNTYPVTVCALSLPDGVEVGDDQEWTAEVDALFYRNWRYRSEYLRRTDEGLRQLSPLLLATRLQRSESTADASWLTQVAVVVLLGLTGFSAAGFFYLRWSDRKYAAARRESKQGQLPDKIDFGDSQ